MFATLVILIVGMLTVEGLSPMPEKSRLPVAGMCTMTTGHSQEMRFNKAWTKTLNNHKEIRPNTEGEAYLLLSSTVTFDPESERLSVMYEAYYVMPGLSGLALNVYSALEVIDPVEYKENQGKKINRAIEVFYIWAQLAAPIFEGLIEPCEEPRIIHTRG